MSLQLTSLPRSMQRKQHAQPACNHVLSRPPGAVRGPASAWMSQARSPMPRRLHGPSGPGPPGQCHSRRRARSTPACARRTRPAGHPGRGGCWSCRGAQAACRAWVDDISWLCVNIHPFPVDAHGCRAGATAGPVHPYGVGRGRGGPVDALTCARIRDGWLRTAARPVVRFHDAPPARHLLPALQAGRRRDLGGFADDQAARVALGVGGGVAGGVVDGRHAVVAGARTGHRAGRQ